MYVVFDLGEEIDIIQAALGRDDMMMEFDMEEPEGETEFEDETNFQVDAIDSEFIEEEEEEEMM